MFLLICIAVAAVFIGTEVLALSTPVAQLTLYRASVAFLLVLTGLQVIRQSPQLTLDARNPACLTPASLAFWWVWAVLSGLWVVSYSQWLQAVFLLTLGVGMVWIFYLHVKTLKQWQILLGIMWFMMTCLMVWGYIEILFNAYWLADLNKLDKYGSFASQPWTRIPITIFENQNDFATLLGAYLPVSASVFRLSRGVHSRLVIGLCYGLGLFLILTTRSRLVFLSVVLYLGLRLVLTVQEELNWKKWGRWALPGLGLLPLLLLLTPGGQDMLSGLVYRYGLYDMSGDMVRLNLWRNGLLFLGQSLGLGVGAGNIEVWMAEKAVLPVENIVNMHNWWLEILTGYGLLVFIFYLLGYLGLALSLWRRSQFVNQAYRGICLSFLAYLAAFSLSSITSANNMLIEWHWVLLAMLVAFVKLLYQPSSQSLLKEGVNHEYHNTYP